MRLVPVSYTHLDVYKRQGREERAIEYALDKVRRDFDQGWQGIEYKLNTCLLYTSMGFAREVATRVLFIDDCKIQEENTPKEFFANPKNPRLKDFLSKVL